MRKEDIENLLNVECPKYEDDCTKCPYSELCNEYSRLGRGEAVCKK